MRDLSKARDEIDNIDTQIIKLFEQRMDIVKDVANYKIENNPNSKTENRNKKVNQ